jgi:hypothetical protein
LAKTSIFVNRNTSQGRRQEILDFSGLSKAHRIDTYVGLPTFVGKFRTLAFKDIIEKFPNGLTIGRLNFYLRLGRKCY